jgi:hypothetical protein
MDLQRDEPVPEASDSSSRSQTRDTYPYRNEEQITLWIVGSHLLERVYSVALFHRIRLQASDTRNPSNEAVARDHHRKAMERRDKTRAIALCGAEYARHKMTSFGIESGGDRLSRSEMTVVDRIESSAQNSDPHDSPGTAEESFLMMPCFNSSRPSPVTEEILISSIRRCLQPLLQLAKTGRVRCVHLCPHTRCGAFRQLGIVLGELFLDRLECPRPGRVLPWPTHPPGVAGLACARYASELDPRPCPR